MSRYRLSAVILVGLLYGGTLFASCKTDACKRATAWKNGYTAIVLNDEITRDEYFKVLTGVHEQGGSIAIETDRAFLGWIPPAAAARLRAMPAVRAVLTSPVSRPAELVRSEQALSALGFFNNVHNGRYEDAIETGLGVEGAPQVGCVVGAQRQPSGSSIDADTGTTGNNSADTTKQLHPTNSALRIAPDYVWHNPPINAAMKGRVTVQVFRLDSSTSTSNLYTWSGSDFITARDQLYGAFTFWVDQANARSVTPAPSFYVNIKDPFNRYTRSFVPTPVNYEPITLPSTYDYQWVNDALARYGFGASPINYDNVLTQNDAFNAQAMSDPTYGPFDHSFTAYVVYNPPPASDHFPDGPNAYVPWWDGPFTVVLWNSAGWGGANLGRVLTHETGHIFWACDEYYDLGFPGCTSCYYCVPPGVGPRNRQSTPWILNANCDYSNPTDGSASLCDDRVECMMKHDSFTLCPHTPAQIGW